MNISLDSKIYKTLEFIYKIIQLNFLVLLGSLGIITIGASFSAMAYVCKKIIEKKDIRVFNEFKKSYLESLKKGIFLSVMFIVLFVLTNIGKQLSGVYMFVQFYGIILFFIIFYVNGNYHLEIKKIMSDSFKILNSHIWLVVPFVGILYVTKYLFYKNFSLFFVLGVGLFLMATNSLIYYVVNKSSKKNQN